MASEEEEIVAAYWLEQFLHGLNVYLWEKYGPPLERLLIPPPAAIDAATLYKADNRIRLAQSLHNVSSVLRAAYDMNTEPW